MRRGDSMFDEKKLYKEDRILKRFIRSYEMRHLHQDMTPLTFSFLVTNRCNLRCKHCFNEKTLKEWNKAEELTIDEYEKLASNLGFFESAFFGGGEPFIRPDFYEIVNIFRDKSKMQWASTTSNGQLTNSILTQLEKIVEHAPDKRFVANFSIDGFEKEHDLTRGQGTFKKSMETIKQVSKLRKKYPKLQLGIVSTMTTINEECFADLFRYMADEVQPNVISLLLVRQAPRADEQMKQVKIENYKKAQDILNELCIEHRNGDPNSPLAYMPLTFYDIISKTMKTGKREFYCYAGRHGAYVDYNGEVNACEVVADKNVSDKPLTMGNLRDYDMDFIKLWNSEQARLIRSQINRLPCCESCTHETEGLLPSMYFSPNSYQERMKKIVRELNKR